ncbi:hypothetical protein BJY52DRAFT_1228605 [Lactarius psammicola]|nr:hypothetical protein BJY52DRAFT_1228605 [Lactarius psammicola]
MAPRTRRQQNSKRQQQSSMTQQNVSTTVAPVPPVANVSESVNSGGGQRTETHQQKLPPLVIRRRPAPEAEPVQSRSTGKKAKRDKGPATNAEQGYSTSDIPRPAKRAKSGPMYTHPPHLELTDDEDESTPKTSVGGKGGDAKTQRGKKLKLSETLSMDDVESNESSETESEKDDLDTESSEDEEVGLSQKTMGRSGQAMALERPSWLVGTTNSASNQMEIDIDGVENPDVSMSIASTNLAVGDPKYTGAHSEGRWVTNRGLIGADSEGHQAANMGLAGEPAHHLTCTTRPPQLQRGNDAGAYSEGHRATNSGLIGEPAHLLTYTHTHPNYAEAHSKGRWVTDAGLTATHLNYAGANLGGLRATDAGPIDEPTRLLSHSLCPPRLRRGDYAGAYSEGRQEINPRLVGTRSEDHKAANPGSVGAHPEGYQVTNVTKTDKTKTNTTDADLMGNYSVGHQAASSGFTGSLQSRKDTAYQWPVETDLVFRSKSGKIRLTEQNLTVRATIAFAFGHLHASIIFQHAFPDALVVTKFIRQALLDASSEIPAAKGVQVRILNDDSYFRTISTLVDLTKECSPEHESVYFVRSIVVGLIEKHLKDFNYIYPRRTNNSAWSAPANVGRPYRSLVIISVIRELYLLETSTFFVCNKHLFPHHPGNDEEPIYEVPKVMVALVATGFYAALHEWSTGERKHIDFTSDFPAPAYGPVASLSQTSAAVLGLSRGVAHRGSWPRLWIWIQPTAKLTAENVGDLELTTHRRVIASGLASPQPQDTPVSLTPSSTISDLVGEPLESTSASATSNNHDSSINHVDAQTPSNKRPRPHPLSRKTTITNDDPDLTDVPDDAPKAKKTKAIVHADISIISIDDGGDLESEPLNKTHPTADIKAFFTSVPLLPGQKKEYMKCNSCAQGLGGCAKQEKILTAEHSTLRRHAESKHAKMVRVKQL